MRELRYIVGVRNRSNERIKIHCRSKNETDKMRELRYIVGVRKKPPFITMSD